MYLKQTYSMSRKLIWLMQQYPIHILLKLSIFRQELTFSMILTYLHAIGVEKTERGELSICEHVGPVQLGLLKVRNISQYESTGQ